MWGTPKDRLFGITLNGRHFLVQQNLLSVLSCLRLPDEVCILWIDAICINQSNISERNHQVGMMGGIYEQAECVLAWVGEATEASNLAMQTLREFDYTKSAKDTSTATDWGVDDENRRNRLALVETLCNREYWLRTWIIQEVLLAKELEIICGGYRVSWKAFGALTRELLRHRFNSFSPNYVLSPAHGQQASYETYMPYDHTVLKRTSAFKILDYKLHGHSFANLAEVLKISASSKCKDPRDKIYATLALIDPKATVRSLVVDYRKSLRQLYLDVMKSCEIDYGRDVSSDLFWAASELGQFGVFLEEVLGLAPPGPSLRQRELQLSASKRIIYHVCRADWYNEGFGPH
jgi:Heterokaryon incompatibility protein (HET)